jgi:Domain of unknown function (DUF1825)
MKQTRILLVHVFCYRLLMTCGYIIPAGQFCPLRSAAWYAYMDHLEAVSKTHGEFTASLRQNHNEMYRLKRAANAFLLEWDRLVEFGTTSSDYQLREYLAEPHSYNLQLAQLQKELIPVAKSLVSPSTDDSHHHDDHDAIASLSSLKIKVEKAACQFSPNNDMNKRDAIEIPIAISAVPFDPEGFRAQSKEVQQEYGKLLRDHRDLIECVGESFGEFDLPRKQGFLEELKKVEERWDIVFQRFHLMNALNPEYVEQCNAWLADLGLDEQQYKMIHQQNLGRLHDGTNHVRFYYL